MLPGSADALARLLDAAPDAMTIVDAADDFRFVNAAWEALFGYRDGELVGTRVTSLLSEEMLAIGVPSRLPSQGQVQRHRAEMIGRRKDGAWVPIDVTTMPVHTASGSMRVLIARDLIARWQAEDLCQSAQELDRKRISDEIHDDSLQSITAASLRLQRLRRGVTEPSELEVLSSIEELLEMTSVGLRRLMIMLHPPALDGLGLAGAIRELLEVMRGDYQVATEVHNRLQHEPSLERRVTLYRIAEEALRAACAVTHPRHIAVEIHHHNQGFLLSLRHDGSTEAGEDFATAAGRARIAVRARLGGGWVRFEPTPGGGAQASIWIPAVASSDEELIPAPQESAA
jgi:PAS domain S-box-containing protein